MASNQVELPNPPSDAISALQYGPGSSTRLLVASWDRHVYLYDTHAEGDGSRGKLLRTFEHRAPVLAVCFGKDENEAFTAGLDWDVRRIDLSTAEQTVLSTHSQGANALIFDPITSLLISSSWDCTIHIHPTASSNSLPSSLSLPHKPFSLSKSPTKLVVAMAARAVHVYDLADLSQAATTAASQPATPNTLATITPEPHQRRESSLKFLTRATACMPSDAGYASSSIEGRVAVEWFDPDAASQARKYAFKCHRQPEDGVDIVYPVNALAFHPVHGTFASGGGDGVVALWDALAKRRIRQYQRYDTSVAALAWSGDGKYLAVAVCEGFEDGIEGVDGGPKGGKVFIREMGDTEAKGKTTK